MVGDELLVVETSEEIRVFDDLKETIRYVQSAITSDAVVVSTKRVRVVKEYSVVITLTEKVE